MNSPTSLVANTAEEKLHSRYDGRWYYCWLIEWRDSPQPKWLGEYSWVTDANEAIWYARKSDADAVCAHDLKGTRKVVVCEHGFDLGEAARSNSFDALTEANKKLREAMFKAELGLAAAQNDQLEIERWMNRDGETHEECKRRLIAEGRAALKSTGAK